MDKGIRTFPIALYISYKTTIFQQKYPNVNSCPILK